MSDSYVSMVEENEIRVGLSYYERARIISKVVEHRVFESNKAALLTLFRSASRAKRSKIHSFLILFETLDAGLKFPQVIGKLLGLQLAKRLETDPELGPWIMTQLQNTPAPDAEAELLAINAVLDTVSSKAKPSLAGSEMTEHMLLPGLKARL